MKLSNRLNEIAKLIDDGSRVIDIGCDHGLLDIYLVKYKDCYCIASDISEKCIKKTNNNIINYGLSSNIEVILSDGLNNIKVSASDIIVISGMGTSTIKHIVNNNLSNRYIIQSNNDYEELREFFVSLGYSIKNETVIYERGNFYITILFVPGITKYTLDDLYLGPIMRYDKNSINYYQYLLDKLKNIYSKMPSYNDDKISLLKNKISIIEKTLGQLRN